MRTEFLPLDHINVQYVMTLFGERNVSEQLIVMNKSISVWSMRDMLIRHHLDIFSSAAVT